MRDFVHGWLEGIEVIKNDPQGSYALVGKALKLDSDTVSGMLSGLKLTPYADNAQFYGLTGGKAHFETLFDTAFVIWRKKGLVTRSVEAKDWADTRFLQALAADYPGQKVEEPKLAAKAPSRARPGDHQQADPDPLHPGLGRDHGRLLHRPRLPGRDHDLLRQHLPAGRGQHRRDRLAEGQPDALRAAGRWR